MCIMFHALNMDILGILYLAYLKPIFCQDNYLILFKYQIHILKAFNLIKIIIVWFYILFFHRTYLLYFFILQKLSYLLCPLNSPFYKLLNNILVNKNQHFLCIHIFFFYFLSNKSAIFYQLNIFHGDLW